METRLFRPQLLLATISLVFLSFSSAFSQISATISWEYRGGFATSTYGAGSNPSGLDTIVAFNVGQQRWTRPCPGDVDGDGDVDFIQCSREGKLYYYENVGTPTNPHWGRRSLPSLDTVWVGVGQATNELMADLADLDADGDLDLLIGSRWRYNATGFAHKLDDIQYLENQGTPTNPVFVKVDETAMGLNFQQCGEFSGVQLVDIDADGDLDLLTMGSDSGATFVNVGDSANPVFQRKLGDAAWPNGNLFDSLRHHFFGRPHLVTQPAFADFDGDGDLDLYGGDDGGTFGYYENIGTPTVPNFRLSGWLPMHGGMDTVDVGQFSSLQFADVTGDGILDILAGQFTPATFTWWEGVEPGPVVSLSIDSAISCNSGSDGGISASVSSGTMPYTYLWSNGATSPSITGLSSTTYTVTVTDNAGLTTSNSIALAQPAAHALLASLDSNVTCNGFLDGGATAIASGGTMPYSYAWNNSATTASITGVAAATYTVTMTDANGCTAINSTAISEPTVLTISASEDSSATCMACSDGGATATASGGTMPYSYAWSNSATTASITGVMAATYTVTITDNNGCTASTSVQVTSGPVVSLMVDSTVSCNGFSDGGISASVSSGTLPYTYLWSNGGTNASITGLSMGTYSLTVTDNAGLSAIQSAFVSQPTTLNATGTSTTNVSCNGFTDGSISTSAGGGTMPYAYLWSNGDTTAASNAIGAATYTVTVTDANGCTDVTSGTVSEPTALVVSAAEDSSATCPTCPDGGATATASGGTMAYTYAWSNSATTASITGVMAATYTITLTDANGCTAIDSAVVGSGPVITMSVDSNALCNADMNGGVSANVTAGTMPYTYAWSNSATTASITGVGAGTYTITVTDAAGLSSVDSATVTEPAVLVATSMLDSNATCNGFSNGGATASATGGTMAYSYAWSNTATTASITGVMAGTYSVTITDANGCTAVDSTIITEPTALVVSAAEDSSATCPTCPDGGATATASGGTMGYTYAWSNSATTASITGVMAATYTITLTDANGCTAIDSAVVGSGPVITMSVDSNALCNADMNGGVSANVTAGTMPYTYAWSNSATTASITGVGAGTYTITVTDAAGLSSVDSATVTEPAVLVATSMLDSNATCNGFSNGGATASATGGTMAYSYAWSNSATTASITGVMAGTYTVIITDANGCSAIDSTSITEPTVLVVSASVDSMATCQVCMDGGASSTASGGTMPYSYAWSNGATTASISGVMASTYTVTITDANGCSDTASVTIQAGPILSMAVDSNASCNGFADGGLSAMASGGTPPLSYLWSNNDTTASIAALVAGTYTVTVTDMLGLTAMDSAVVTEPTAVVATAAVDSNVTCNGFADGGASATATGGVGSYSFVWSTGDSTAAVTGLAGGAYLVTASDADGCTSVDSVSVAEPMQLVASAAITATVSCNGLADGAVSVASTGGTLPVAYAWSNNANADSVAQLSAGTYVVTATDANGCTSTDTATVSQPDLLIATATIDANVLCNGGNDGAATAVATGGTLPYNYVWAGGQTMATISGQAAGTYDVTITDANGCTGSASLTIIEPTLLEASIDTVANVGCEGNYDGSASASGNGGVLPYSYAWSTGGTAANEMQLEAGSISVTVTDVNGCATSASGTVSFTYSAPSIDLGADVAVNTPSVEITAPAGFASYLWSNGSTDASALIAHNGPVWVAATDSNGCVASDTIQVNIWPAGIGSAQEQAVLRAWPNPTAGLLQVEIRGMGNETTAWSLLSLDGRVAAAGRIQVAGNTGRAQVSLDGLPAGTYVLRVANSKGIQNLRINKL